MSKTATITVYYSPPGSGHATFTGEHVEYVFVEVGLLIKNFSYKETSGHATFSAGSWSWVQYSKPTVAT